MDAFLPVLIAAAFAQFSDRAPMLAAVLSDRYAAPRRVLLAFAAAHLIGFALAAGAGLIMANVMTPEARRLILGLAFLFGAFGMAWRSGSLDRLEGWRIGAVATAFLGAFILAFGDRTQFLALGFSAWSASPVLPALGATIGAMIPTAVAVTMGAAAWSRLPHRWVRYATAAVFGLTGVLLALSAWGLI